MIASLGSTTTDGWVTTVGWVTITTAGSTTTEVFRIPIGLGSTGSNVTWEAVEDPEAERRRRTFQRSQEALQAARQANQSTRPLPCPEALYSRPRMKGRTCSGASRYRTLIH